MEYLAQNHVELDFYGHYSKQHVCLVLTCRPASPAVIKEVAPISYSYGYNPIWFKLENEFPIGSTAFASRIDIVAEEVSRILLE